jgi:uncharacterized DUF497 family protein
MLELSIKSRMFSILNFGPLSHIYFRILFSISFRIDGTILSSPEQNIQIFPLDKNTATAQYFLNWAAMNSAVLAQPFLWRNWVVRHLKLDGRNQGEKRFIAIGMHLYRPLLRWIFVMETTVEQYLVICNFMLELSIKSRMLSILNFGPLSHIYFRILFPISFKIDGTILSSPEQNIQTFPLDKNTATAQYFLNWAAMNSPVLAQPFLWRNWVVRHLKLDRRNQGEKRFIAIGMHLYRPILRWIFVMETTVE